VKIGVSSTNTAAAGASSTNTAAARGGVPYAYTCIGIHA